MFVLAFCGIFKLFDLISLTLISLYVCWLLGLTKLNFQDHTEKKTSYVYVYMCVVVHVCACGSVFVFTYIKQFIMHIFYILYVLHCENTAGV